MNQWKEYYLERLNEERRNEFSRQKNSNLSNSYPTELQNQSRAWNVSTPLVQRNRECWLVQLWAGMYSVFLRTAVYFNLRLWINLPLLLISNTYSVLICHPLYIENLLLFINRWRHIGKRHSVVTLGRPKNILGTDLERP